MTEKQQIIVKKAVRVGGWQVIRRGARMLPFGGALIAITLVGTDIKRKGVVKGVLNSGLDALPVVGLVKNGYEFFAGDIISDKPTRRRGNGKE